MNLCNYLILFQPCCCRFAAVFGLFVLLHHDPVCFSCQTDGFTFDARIVWSTRSLVVHSDTTLQTQVVLLNNFRIWRRSDNFYYDLTLKTQQPSLIAKIITRWNLTDSCSKSCSKHSCLYSFTENLTLPTMFLRINVAKAC